MPVDTVPRLLAHWAKACAEREALVCDDRTMTYADLDRASMAVARSLLAGGIAANDRVGVLMPDGTDWAAVAYAVMRLGAVVVPLSTLLRPEELRAQLRAADVTALVVEPGIRGRDHLAELAEAVPHLRPSGDGLVLTPGLPTLRRVWRWPDDLPPAAADTTEALVRELEARVRPADDLVVMFTSGSQGGPKGVIHTHASAIAAVRANHHARGIHEGERMFIQMPFFWMGGFGGGVLTTLVAGATLLIESSGDPEAVAAFVTRHRVTLFRGWPSQGERVAAAARRAGRDLPPLSDASLPAVLPPGRRPAPGARANLFGMTETFGPYCGSDLGSDLPPDKHGSCGRPFAAVTVRVADPVGGAERPPGEPGEIQVRGPALMRGIAGRLRSEIFTPDGFYPTGDLATIDADGYLWYLGRVDDMFKVSGATVYPSEVEEVLRHLPGVRAAHVLPVTVGGETRAGVVVITEEVDVDQLATLTRQRLSAFKVPRLWLEVPDPDELPRMASGKIDRRALRQRLEAEGIRT